MSKILCDGDMINQSNPRLTKAFDLLDSVIDIDDTFATVISNGSKYKVNYRKLICPCKDNSCRKIKCKHIYAVLIKTGIMKVVKVT